MNLKIASTLLAGCLLSNTGNATLVSLDVSIHAWDFVKSSGSPSELSPPPLILDFEVVFDNVDDVLNTSAGLVTKSSTWSSLTGYRYEKYHDALALWGAEDFFFSFQIANVSSSTPIAGGVDRYTSAGYWLARRTEAQIEAGPMPVPEPGVLPMASIGLALILAFVRKATIRGLTHHSSGLPTATAEFRR